MFPVIGCIYGLCDLRRFEMSTLSSYQWLTISFPKRPLTLIYGTIRGLCGWLGLARRLGDL